MSKHPIVHIEISAQDPNAAAKFYEELFGWDTRIDRSVPGMDYVMFSAEPGTGGAFNPVDNEMTNPGDIFVYVATDDIDATLAKAESLGGKTLVPKSEIPNVGWFAFFVDPTGNRIGLLTTPGE